MLDNGAFEGHPVTGEELHQASKLVGADEVVLPDVPGDATKTLSKSWKALKDIETPGVIFVPQGESILEWQACLDAWMSKWKGSVADKHDLVIGITGLRKVKEVGARCALVAYVEASYDVPIHLLGIPDPKEFAMYLPCYENVRGVDTSLTFALGCARKLLTPETEKVSLGSPEQYACLGHWTHTLTYLNMLILEHWTLHHRTPEYIPLELFRQAAIWGGGNARQVSSLPQVALRQCHLPEGGYAICDKGVRFCPVEDLRGNEELIGVYATAPSQHATQPLN